MEITRIEQNVLKILNLISVHSITFLVRCELFLRIRVLEAVRLLEIHNLSVFSTDI